jgi:hypothetical protein
MKGHSFPMVSSLQRRQKIPSHLVPVNTYLVGARYDLSTEYDGRPATEHLPYGNGSEKQRGWDEPLDARLGQEKTPDSFFVSQAQSIRQRTCRCRFHLRGHHCIQDLNTSCLALELKQIGINRSAATLMRQDGHPRDDTLDYGARELATNTANGEGLPTSAAPADQPIRISHNSHDSRER